MPKKQLYTLSLLLLSLIVNFKTKAQSIIAQSTSYFAGGHTLINDNDPDYPEYLEVGQTFKSLLTTTISTIEILSSGGNGITCDLQFYSNTSQNAWGSLLNTKTNIAIPGSVGWVTIDISSLNISVTTGNYYGFKLIPHVGGYAGFYVSANGYADGQAWTSTGFKSTNDFAFKVSTNATLPVHFISFTAQKQNEDVLLKWSTATESDSKDFIIQHSTNGNRWNPLGTIAAAGNSNSIINYQYLHTNPTDGVNYYRLLQTDLDGKSSFSEIRTVKFSNDNKVFTVLSNPIQSNQLCMKLTETRMASLFTSNGNLVWRKELLPGLHTIDMSTCSKGLYLLQVGTVIERVILK